MRNFLSASEQSITIHYCYASKTAAREVGCRTGTARLRLANNLQVAPLFIHSWPTHTLSI